MKYLFLLIAVLISGCGTDRMDEGLVQTTSQTTVRITREDGSPLGSGSIVQYGMSKYILTNWHVCRHNMVGYSTYSPSTNVLVRGKILKSERKVDLCAIELDSSVSNQKGALRLAHSIYTYQKILALGFPLDHPLEPAFGYTVLREKIKVAYTPDRNDPCSNSDHRGPNLICFEVFDVIKTNIVTYPGNSGSPVVDMSGRLIGVINSSDNETHDGNFIPLDSVKKFLDSIN